MNKEKIFKKISSWNTFFIVFGILSALMGLYNLYGNITWDSKYANTDMESLKPATITVVISAIITLVTIYTIILAIKNRTKISDKMAINTMPYIITLLVQVYSIVTGIVTMFLTKDNVSGMMNMAMESVDGMEGMEGFFATMMIVTFGIVAITYFLGIFPSIRILLLNKKAGKINEEEVSSIENDEEE